MEKKKKLYIISGCNGAGKTTASFNILPEILDCKEFVNADEIARGISPFQPSKVAFEAGRIMLKRIKELIASGDDFAFETTLASLTYKKYVEEAQRKGYHVTLIYYWLESPQLAEHRVSKRVKEGGHFIPKEVVQRRYLKGIRYLFEVYLPICDYAMVFDNSQLNPILVCKRKKTDLRETIMDSKRFNRIKDYLS